MRRTLLPLAFAGFVAAAVVSLAPPRVRADAGATPKGKSDKSGVEVKLKETSAFRVFVARGSRSAEARARAAVRALEQALAADDPQARREIQGDAHVIFAADAPVIELYAEDAAAAGDSSLDVHSARVLSRVRQALTIEKQRSDIADTVFSISLIVFAAFIALYLLRLLGSQASRARELVLEHPEKVPAIRLRSFEVLGSGALRGVLLGALILGRAALEIGIIYAWLVFSLSQFDATRPYTERLTSLLTTPLLALFERLAFALPLGLLALFFSALVYILVRFVELFFVSVRRGETRLAWLPADLVAPVSVLARAAVVVLALLFAGPLLTGDSGGALSRSGAILLVALGLSITPLFAAAFVGIVQMLSRRVRVGTTIEIAGQRGQVADVGFFDTTLRRDDGGVVRVPHLLVLVSPQRSVEPARRARVTISVAPTTPLTAAKELLLATASAFGAAAEVELVEIDAQGARFCVAVLPPADAAPSIESDLRLLLAEALARAGFALGGRATERTP